MSPLITRVPAGIRAGGQFAAHTHAEPEVNLGKTFSEDMLRQITNRYEGEGAPVIDLTEYQLAAVRDHIDRTGDFSHPGIRKAAEDAYFLENRFTHEEHRNFVNARSDISVYFGDSGALRRDIEQMRKDQAGALYSTVGQP
ncbi:hypothetical protein [Paenarthrobacter sp. YJN-5]|uniref:hypothetical protein n=1 Tax=Paenarthrobacter sp. YJN-5 TaxID=2735316 RepID=UPI001878DFCC|nr:hypothetical protein [Paenarthrobacter sp. YJN-5]QOT19295.1 hypothetical protein HMI59_21605 [Paenarthrobacter sp. YJN-5]